MMSAYDGMAPPGPRPGEIARCLVEPAVVAPDGANRAHVIDLLRHSRVRWLKNTEVCDILLNYRQYDFRLSTTAPITPPAGTLFLFDRKTTRFFRKDGHDWAKKKDGKTVRETHEKLKVGNVELLNCYYAHAARDDRFQRRCYWHLNSDEGVVLVHYLRVTQKAAAQEAVAGFGQPLAPGGSGNGSPRFRVPVPVPVPVPVGLPGHGGVHRVRSGGDVLSVGAPQHHLSQAAYEVGPPEQARRALRGVGAGEWSADANGFAPNQSFPLAPSSASHAFEGGGFAGVSHANAAAAAAASKYQREDPWFDGALESGDAGGGYDAPGDADMDFFLRDASMDVGDAGDAPAENDAFGYAILRDFVHQEALASGVDARDASAVPSKPPSLGSLGSLGQAERRVSESLSVGGGDSQLGVAVAAAAGVGGDGAASGPKKEPQRDGVDHAAGAPVGPAAAAAAAGPAVGTSFPASGAAADVVERAPPRAPSRGASSTAGLALANAPEGGGGRLTPPPARAASPVVPGSFEDGARTARELESRVADLQRSLARVARATADEAHGQLSRLERDMSALESGHRAMAARGHRRRESADRRGALASRPVRWDARSDDDDGGADEEDDDGEDDDDEEGDANEDGNGTISSLAKAAAATRRPGAAGGASARDRARGGYASFPPPPSGSEMDLTDRDDAEDAVGGEGPRAPSPAAAAAQLRAAAATAHARASRGHHRTRPMMPANFSGAQILWEIVDFSPEWDDESGGAKVLVSGAPRPGWPEGMYLCCVFGNVEVPAEQISPSTLRCRAPPHAPGRVPFYISCLGSGKRPVSDIRTFEYREAGASNARDRRAAEVRLATGVTERDFQLRLVHLLIGADRSSVKSEGRGGGGGGGSGGGSGGGDGDAPGSGGSGSGGNDAGDAGGPSGSVGRGASGDAPASAPSGGVNGGAIAASLSGLPGTRKSAAAPPPGASFVKKTLAQLGLPGDPASAPETLSDEDVARAFRAAIDARLRHTISAEAKSLRARAGVAVVSAVAAPEQTAGSDAPSALLTQQRLPAPGFASPARSAYRRVDAGGVGIVHCVAALGMNWAIPALCKSGCDVNQPDRRRRTALHWAAAKGHEDTVATLLASGANIRATARWGAGGYTAADLAAALGHGGIAAYISETSLAASLSNISLYGGPQGAARRFGDRAGTLAVRRPAATAGPSVTHGASTAGSGRGVDHVGTVAPSRPSPAPPPTSALAGVSSPMVADVDTPAMTAAAAGARLARGGRFARARAGEVEPMRSLLLATETEVTATDFDSRTDLTDLETDAGEPGAPGATGGGDEACRERTAAGMIQLAFRKHASRRRKLRRRGGSGAAGGPGGPGAGAGLGSVEELAEPKPAEKEKASAAAAGDSEDDEDEDEDVKRNVKKVVKKAEKAAMKITSSIRSLKTSQTAGLDCESRLADARAAGKRGRGGKALAAAGPSARDDVPSSAAPSGDAASPSVGAPRTTREEAVAEVERRIGELRARAGALLHESERGAPGSAHRRRVPAGDIVRLVKVNGLAGSQHRLEALREMRREKTTPRAPRSSPSRASRKAKRDSDQDSNARSGASRGRSVSDDGEEDEEDEEAADDARRSEKSSRLRGHAFARKATNAAAMGDDDDDEEDAKVAVERIQAIIRSRRAREQYLRLRSVTMSLQERIAARARGEVPMGEDGDGDDIEVDDDDDDDGQE